MVAEGDTVKAGTPLLFCKMMEDVKYCAPVSGEIVEIKRGEKRKLLEIKILADKEIASEKFKKFEASELNKVEKQEAIDLMKNSGVWPNIIQRPYGIVANPDETPKSIFISTFDTHPLAPDLDFALNGEENYFQAGIDVLRKLTTGEVNISLNGKGEVSSTFSHAKNAKHHRISGKHPAGN